MERLVIACLALCTGLALGCSSADGSSSGDDDGSGDSDADGDTDTDTDTDSDSDSDCEEGMLTCIEDDAYVCEGGEWVLSDDCDEEIGESCLAGECYGPCEFAEGMESYIGCEYYAACLPGGNDPYVVVLSNVSEITANVVIEENNAEYGEDPLIATVWSGTVSPGTLVAQELEFKAPSNGSYDTINSYLSATPYHIVSDAPIVVYQFNPYDNHATNDASLLLPVHVLGKEYVVMAWPQTQNAPSFMTVVGTVDGTEVTVVPATDISASDSGGPVPVYASDEGEEVTYVLDKGEMLNLTNENQNGMEPARGEDYTGSIVTATEPVAVFAGGVTVDVPHFMDVADWYCCADHIEQQIFPEKTLGKEFVAARTPIRSEGEFVEPEYWRVLATVDGTVVTTTLDPPDDEVTLDRGEHVEFEQTGDFLVTASEPVLLGQFVASGDTTNTTSYNGDPAYILVPPHEQFRDHYITLTPDTYELDFVIVTVPNDGTVFTVDGLPPESSDCLADPVTDAWFVYRCPVSDGAHEIEATGPVGLVVYGYEHHTSYGYSGGLDMEAINPDVE